MDDLDTLASRGRYIQIARQEDDEIVYSNMETTFAIANRGGEFVVESASRNTRRIALLMASDLATARRYLAAAFAADLRSEARMPELRAAHAARGVTIDSEGSSALVTWPGGWARYAAARFAGRYAITFSHLITASIEDIAASYDDPGGRPLFV